MSKIIKDDFMIDPDIISVLQTFMGLRIDKLHEKPLLKHIKILNYYLKNPAKATYEYCKDVVDNDTPELRTIYRHIGELLKDGFLEPVFESQDFKREMRKNYRKPLKLSLSGIFCIILYTPDISCIELVRKILKNYRENCLFVRFLYPIIKEKTLDEIEWDILFYSIVVEYLRSVCRDIVFAIKYLKDMCKNLSVDGYLMDRVFIWHNDSRENSNQDLVDKIRFFLENTLKWENTGSLRINPNTHENTIEIVDVLNPLRDTKITILKSQGKAVLRQNGQRLHEFSVVPYGPLLSVESKSNRKAIDEIKLPFIERYGEQLIGFLTKLRTGLVQSTSLCTNPTFETLSEDERYQKALEYLNRELNIKQ